MFNKKVVKYRTVLAVCLYSMTFDVFAGSAPASGSLHYAPDASVASIPTLGTIMLIVLSLLLFVVGLRLSKKKGVGKLFTLFAGVLCLIPVLNGEKLINNAMAIGFLIDLSDPTGGVAGIPDASDTTIYKNTSGVKQKIIQIDTPTSAGACVVNVSESTCKANITSLENGDMCEVKCGPSGG